MRKIRDEENACQGNLLLYSLQRHNTHLARSELVKGAPTSLPGLTIIDFDPIVLTRSAKIFSDWRLASRTPNKFKNLKGKSFVLSTPMEESKIIFSGLVLDASIASSILITVSTHAACGLLPSSHFLVGKAVVPDKRYEEGSEF